MLKGEIEKAPILSNSIVLARWIFNHVDVMTPEELAQVLDRLGDVQRSMQARGEVPTWAKDAA